MRENTSPTSVQQHKPGLLLAGILLAVTVVPTGVSGTGIALPAIAQDLGNSSSQLHWVVNAFNLSFAVFSLIAGSFADRLGRQRGFILGSILFGGAALLSMLAPTLLVLDIARGIAGLGAALIFSCAGALIAITFSGSQATRAFSFFGTAAGLGLGLGPSISALALTAGGWRGIFLFNALGILIAIALVVTSRVKDKPDHATTTLDFTGALSFGSFLTLLITAIVHAGNVGWANLSTLIMFACSAFLLALFIRIELHSSSPLLDLHLLSSPKLIGLLLVPVAGAIGFVTLLTYYPTYLTGLWGLNVGQLGTLMLAMTLPVVVGPLIAGALHTAGISTSLILGTSVAFYALGAFLLTFITDTAHIPLLIIAFIIIGLGFGLGVGLVDGQAIVSVPAHKTGMVSGLVSTVRLSSEAITVAVFASILSSTLSHKLTLEFSQLNGPDLRSATDLLLSGDLESLTPAYPLQTLRTILAESYSPLLWSLVVISCMLAIIVTLLLSRSQRKELNCD